MSKPIELLPAAAALTGDELVHLVQGGDSRRSTAAAIAALGGGSMFVTPQQFGAVGDGVADDTDAFKDAIDFLDGNLTGNTGASRLFIPKGTYRLTDTLHIRASMIVEGDGPLTTKLVWPAGKTGIIVQRVNTDDTLTGSTTPFSVGGGDWATIRMLRLVGGYAGVEGEFHGIALRARAYLDTLLIENWQGDGIYSDATAGGAPEGNANCAVLLRCQSTLNRKGMFVDGADTNEWLVLGGDFRINRSWGVDDSSFLGNNYTGCHTAGNGWDGALGSIPTGCTYLGNRYGVRAGQAVWCKTNAPSGTVADNTGWIYEGAGGTYNGVVAWVSGTDFREGGGYKSDNSNARNVYNGCYSEGDQNYSQTIYPSLQLGGFMLSIGNEVGTFNGRGVGPDAGSTASDGRWDIRNVQLQTSILNFQSLIDGAEVLQSKIYATSWYTGGHLFYDAIGAKHWWRLTGADAAQLDATGFNLAAGKVYTIAGTQVVAARGAAVADAVNAAAAPTQAEFNAFVAQFNALLARVRAHGLIAP